MAELSSTEQPLNPSLRDLPDQPEAVIGELGHLRRRCSDHRRDSVLSTDAVQYIIKEVENCFFRMITWEQDLLHDNNGDEAAQAQDIQRRSPLRSFSESEDDGVKEQGGLLLSRFVNIRSNIRKLMSSILELQRSDEEVESSGDSDRVNNVITDARATTSQTSSEIDNLNRMTEAIWNIQAVENGTGPQWPRRMEINQIYQRVADQHHGASDTVLFRPASRQESPASTTSVSAGDSTRGMLHDILYLLIAVIKSMRQAPRLDIRALPTMSKQTIFVGALSFFELVFASLLVIPSTLLLFLPLGTSLLAAAVSFMLVRKMDWYADTLSRLLGIRTDNISAFMPGGDTIWIHLGGNLMGWSALERERNAIKAVFHQEPICIFGPPLGVVFYLLHCFGLRNVNIRTRQASKALEFIQRSFLRRPYDRLILTASGRGCLAASQIFEELLSTLTESDLSRIEVYTFGSVAKRFPTYVSKPGGLKHPPSHSEALYAEHYGDENDLLVRWCLKRAIESREYGGKIFIRRCEWARGPSLFSSEFMYYLEVMFGLERATQTLRRSNVSFEKAKMTPLERESATVLSGGSREETVRDQSRLLQYVAGKKPQLRALRPENDEGR